MTPTSHAHHARLVVTPPSTRYAALHSLELRAARCSALGTRLWRAVVDDDGLQHLLDAESAHDVLQPLVRAHSYEALLATLESQPPPTLCPNRPWTLRFEAHGAAHQASGDARATEYLCGVARYLPGPPALRGIDADDGSPLTLVVLRSRRLWYLAASEARGRAARVQRQRTVWSERPYSFSAATDPTLAQLALSIALQHARAHAPPGAPAPALLDPCCGSGTVLYAAAQRAIRSVGCDLNPLVRQLGVEPEARVSWGRTGGPRQLGSNRWPASAGVEPEVRVSWGRTGGQRQLGSNPRPASAGVEPKDCMSGCRTGGAYQL